MEDRCLLTAYTLTDLGTLGGGSTAFAYDINEAGQVVGYATYFDPDTTDEIYESFLYSDGVMIDLGVPGDLNRAHDINDAGQIVGYALSGGSYHAVLLTPTEEGTPTVSVDDVTVTEGNTSTSDAVFTVTLSKPASEEVTVHFTTGGGTATAGSDYAAQSGTVTFAPGEASATVTVAVNGDTTVESNETFQVTLSQARQARRSPSTLRATDGASRTKRSSSSCPGPWAPQLRTT